MLFKACLRRYAGLSAKLAVLQSRHAADVRSDLDLREHPLPCFRLLHSPSPPNTHYLAMPKCTLSISRWQRWSLFFFPLLREETRVSRVLSVKLRSRCLCNFLCQMCVLFTDCVYRGGEENGEAGGARPEAGAARWAAPP